MPSQYGPVAVNVNTGALEYSTSGYEAAGSVSTHEADTTSVHGVTDTAQLPAKNASNTFSARQIVTGTGAGLNATDFATSMVNLRSTSTAALNEGPAIMLGGETGNGVTPYPYGTIQATKDSAGAGDYTAGFRMSSMTAAGGATQFFRGTGDGNVILGKGTLAQAATQGFLYIPTMAGAPSGVPVAQTGFVAIVFNTTDNKLHVYDGAWLATAALS